ncbi:TPA: exotoxin beta-grasp domain-containing protein [Staphylococcus aureus]|uniref:exotoxin beta-grasp domain-containing protein n=1 Tax=Staphylococcus aureus TaxID=1280 RepID=UPI00122E6977|nr:exotoxin beta-grasp domain-containing protein [Staphylococcus aureus]MCB8116351.1 exotoxin [Staphylococcus aureus]MCC5280669.1 exotoxin [Staphylococcus aureus]MCS4930174.1 exotoxin [Staphylococcus aureus]MCS5077933.1 exotoxin [Staphylococcus aureus]HCG2330458.1 exotoxin [Staphylococcus aureus]
MKKSKAMLNVLLLIIYLIAICSVNNAYANEENPKIEDLCKKSSVDDIALHNIDKDYMTNRFIINESPVLTTEKFLDFDLLFKNFTWLDGKSVEFKDLKVEFSSSEISKEYFGKTVDIYGVYYKAHCHGEHQVKTACTYGGVTPHENNKLNEPKEIGVAVYKDNVNVNTFIVTTDKKKVTAQELDIKVRTKLNNVYKLYDRMTSDVQKGYIKFHSHSEHKESFYYDLFYIKGNLPDQYLQIYNDNKTIDSSDYHIDVYLFT